MKTLTKNYATTIKTPQKVKLSEELDCYMLPLSGLSAAMLSSISDDEKRIAKLVAETVCDESGKPLWTPQEVSRIEDVALVASLITKVVEFHDLGSKKKISKKK